MVTARHNMDRRKFMKYTSMMALSSMLPFSSCKSNDNKSSQRPNIICFVSDDLDLNFLSCYGGKIPTLNIDSLAHDGVRFENAFCSSAACTPSRYSILTGQYAGRCTHPEFLKENPITEPYAINWNSLIDQSTPTVADFLSTAGYYTGYVGKWHNGVKPPQLSLPDIHPDDDPDDENVNQKLGQYQKVLIEELNKTSGFDFAASILWENWEQAPLKKIRHHNIEWITHGAMTFFDTIDTDQPFFLYVASTAVHGPDHAASIERDVRYTPEGKFEEPFDYHPPRKSLPSRLANMGIEWNHQNVGITMLDDQVGAILKRLEQKNLTDNTLFLFIADHNTEPGKISCYEKGVKVPMLVKWHGKVKSGTVCKALVQNIDLVPTFLEAAQTSFPQNVKVDGQSFLSSITGKSYSEREYLYFENGYTRGIRNHQFKYIAFRYPKSIIQKMEAGELQEATNHLNISTQEQPYITMRYYPAYFDADQLYDLKNDPYEQHNLASDQSYAQVLSDMKQELKKYLGFFTHPYDVEDTAFLESDRFKALAEITRKKGTRHIPWWNDKFVWPPSK